MGAYPEFSRWDQCNREGLCKGKNKVGALKEELC